MPTVAQEMPAEERRTRLLNGLNATKEEDVIVNFSHLAHAVGMDSAERLVQTLVAMDSLESTAYSRKPKYTSVGLCAINRIDAIEAIERVQIQTAKINIDKVLRK